MVLTVRQTTGIPPLAVLDRGDQRPCCAGRAASLWWSQLQFSDTLVTSPLLPTTGAWGLTVQKNCGGPAVAVQRSSLISLSWSRGRFPWSSCSEDHGDSAVAVFFLVVDAPVVQVVFHARVGRFRPRVLGQGNMPVVQRQAAWFDTGFMVLPVYVAIPQVQLLDKVVVPGVCTTNALVQLLLTVEVPQLQFLFYVVNIPVGAQRQLPMASLFRDH